MTRHVVIPDTQVKPGVDTVHLEWAARAIVEYKPDVIVHLGDHWDLPSLSTHDAPGSKEAEGRNVKSDIDAGNEAWERLNRPIEKEIDRLRRRKQKRWEPRRVRLNGNHEDRMSRAIYRDPKFDGILSLDSLKSPGWEVIPYLKILTIDGIRYCHKFANPHSGKGIGGTITNRLGKIGGTFIQGHEQGRLYATQQYPDHVCHGLVVGSFYLHNETYRPGDVQNSEWRGIVVLNEVQEGDFDIMPLSMSYLRKRFS
jgi:hypothetical protein